MKHGDKVIWDSGFGYDIGYFVGDDVIQLGNVTIRLITGISHGALSSFSEREIIPYTDKSIELMKKTYGY